MIELFLSSRSHNRTLQRPVPPNPYLILDPRRAATEFTGQYSPSKPVPPHVRDFGYVPDDSQLLPGDLILISAIMPSRGSRAIIKAQTIGGHHSEDARWHHV